MESQPSSQPHKPRMTREVYYYKHILCPACANLHTSQTYAGCTFDRDHPDEFRDMNLATCKCGWRGRVHDLVEMK